MEPVNRTVGRSDAVESSEIGGRDTPHQGLRAATGIGSSASSSPPNLLLHNEEGRWIEVRTRDRATLLVLRPRQGGRPAAPEELHTSNFFEGGAIVAVKSQEPFLRGPRARLALPIEDGWSVKEAATVAARRARPR